MPQPHDDRVPSEPATRRVRGGEWPAVGLSFAYFFCVLAAYYVIRPLREQLDIDSMDALNFVVGLHGALGVDIPESD